METNYSKYRGKCKEKAVELAAVKPSLRVVKGHYHCPIWGNQQHWWCEDENGVVVDPTAKQFPSGGIGEYVEFDGYAECSQCGTRKREEEMRFEGSYAFCSGKCFGVFVGVM
jgi:hypothetical protein